MAKFRVKYLNNNVRQDTKTVINIAIVDNEPICVRIIKKFIEDSVHSKEREIKVSTYTNSKEVLDAAMQVKFDILFMDVDLENHVSGIDIAYKIKEICPDCLIIYISGYTCYYAQMVKNGLFGFLEKPIRKSEFSALFRRALERFDTVYKKYEIEYKGIHTIVRPCEIIYAYSRSRKCNFVMDGNETLTFYKKLDDLEKEINEIYPHFVRVNKSFLVNYIHIRAVRKYSVIMDNGDELSISRAYRDGSVSKIFEGI